MDSVRNFHSQNDSKGRLLSTFTDNFQMLHDSICIQMLHDSISVREYDSVTGRGTPSRARGWALV